MRKALIAVTLALGTQWASAQSSDASTVERGKYIATAADCAGCHGENLAGGAAIASPLGPIYASNITPDTRTGIGSWSEEQLRDALRKGRAPGKGWLYPAMPYTSYTGISDADLSALYAYLQSVPAVNHEVRATDLGFPFMRPAMIAWNLLYLKEGHAAGEKPAHGESAERGRYLVEALGHCSACHTPRGVLMAELPEQHLGGAFVGGWQAPNLTNDKSGLGSWSDQELTQFLQKGHNSVAVAGGDMGLAVSRSLSHLGDSDIADIIAYLRQVPPVATQALPAAPSRPARVDPDTVEGPITGWRNLANNATTDGAVLYQSACASCHGVDGTGTAGPDLGRLRDLRSAHPNNLVQVIAGGINLEIDGRHILMPGFRDQMNNEQIAALARYVRSTFGQVPGSGPDEQEVASILSDKTPVSWLIKYAPALAWGAIVVLVLLVGWVFARRKA